MSPNELVRDRNAAGSSNKRKARHESSSARPSKQRKQTSKENINGSFDPAVKSADHATNTALKHLFAFGDSDDSDAQLDKVLSCAYDEDLICSALCIAGTRMKRWTADKNAEYGDDIRMHQIIARLKKRWAIKLLPHLFENLDEGLDFPYKHISVITETTHRYKIELRVTPTFSADEFQEGISEHGVDAEDVLLSEDDDYVPPSVVSGALRRSMTQHYADNGSQQPCRAPTLPPSPDTSPEAESDGATPRPDNTSTETNLFLSSPRLHGFNFERFSTIEHPDATLILRVPRGAKQGRKIGPDEVHSAVREGIKGKVAVCNLLQTDLYNKLNRVWTVRFQDAAAALRANGLGISVMGNLLRFEPFDPNMSTVFVCNRFPANATRLSARTELSAIFGEQDLPMKWTTYEPTNPRYKRQRCAFQLRRPSDVSEFYIRLHKSFDDTRRPQIHFKVWLDKSLCGVCRTGKHQTLDCPQLTENV